MEPGQTVKEGETLVVMEAMKMEVSEISVYLPLVLTKTAVKLKGEEGGEGGKTIKEEDRP